MSNNSCGHRQTYTEIVAAVTASRPTTVVGLLASHTGSQVLWHHRARDGGDVGVGEGTASEIEVAVVKVAGGTDACVASAVSAASVKGQGDCLCMQSGQTDRF